MGIYLGDWKEKEDVFREFSSDYSELDSEMKQEMKNCNILLAWYGNGGYDGSAFVLFERDGQLYEVNGGHCSCYGLEGQWEPELTSDEALKYRVRNGELGQDTYYECGIFGEQLMTILETWKLVEFVQYGELVH